MPEMAAGEGAGGGCMTFQRVGGRGCCRGARRPIGSFGVPDWRSASWPVEGAGGGCIGRRPSNASEGEGAVGVPEDL